MPEGSAALSEAAAASVAQHGAAEGAAAEAAEGCTEGGALCCRACLQTYVIVTRGQQGF